MAVVRWLGGSGDASAVANYSSNPALPAINDDLLFDSPVAFGPSTNLNALDAKTGLKVYRGPLFNKNIGLLATPMQFGTGSTLTFDARTSEVANFDMESCSLAKILNTGADQNSLILSAGTFTATRVQRAPGLTLGASFVGTTVELLGYNDPLRDIVLQMLAGAAITNFNAAAGIIFDYATPTNVTLSGECEYHHVNAAADTIAALTIYMSRFFAEGVSPTYTAIVQRGGVFNLNKSRSPVLTAAEFWPRTEADLRSDGGLGTGTVTKKGARIIAFDSGITVNDAGVLVAA